jgi:hypothetical protein
MHISTMVIKEILFFLYILSIDKLSFDTSQVGGMLIYQANKLILFFSPEVSTKS